jgi:hypothetical protein
VDISVVKKWRGAVVELGIKWVLLAFYSPQFDRMLMDILKRKLYIQNRMNAFMFSKKPSMDLLKT